MARIQRGNGVKTMLAFWLVMGLLALGALKTIFCGIFLTLRGEDLWKR
jgi:hypothetical protein